MDVQFPDDVWKRKLRRQLLAWFGANARPLPWRENRDPYRVWISEIMLQQTQVETVKEYFRRFTKRFPNVEELAAADEQEVLRYWEGLGYYRRARQLHKAAQRIATDHQGRFPSDVDSVRDLPGIGRYTTGAIMSIAFDAREPILEANTIRLFSRLLTYAGDPRSTQGQQVLWRFANEILPRKNVGAFNQSLMELGSEICVPKDPRCLNCPVKSICPTFATGQQAQIPMAAPKKKYEDVHEIAVVVRKRGKVLIRQCGEGERWAGLWDFPRFAAVNRKMDTQIVNEVQRLTGTLVTPGSKLTSIRHGVTRFRITLDCYEAEYDSGRVLKKNGCTWSHANQLDAFPLSVTGRKISNLLQSVS